MRGRRRKFTLIEMLVVIAIIAILLSVLLPGLNSARLAAKRIACAGNLKNVGSAMMCYMQDSDESFPITYSVSPGLYTRCWYKLLREYVNVNWDRGGDPSYNTVYTCPSDRMPRIQDRSKVSYSINHGMYWTNDSSCNGISWVDGSLRAVAVKAPATTVSFAEYWGQYGYLGHGASASAIYSSVGIVGVYDGVCISYHNGIGGGNYIFCDGHLEFAPKPNWAYSNWTESNFKVVK